MAENYDLPEQYRNTPYDQLPAGMQRRVYRADPSVANVPHPAAQPMAEEASTNLEDVPEGASFPHHRGGGWYVLSDGTSVQGEDAALDQQAELDLDE